MGDIGISIILPVYNVEKYLGRCLTSILRQEKQDIEIIAVEDCSTDNSLKILKEYAVQYTQIKLIQNDQNRGLAYSRNRGIQAASGKYIYFMDSDDLLRDGALNYMYLCAEENSCDVVTFNADRVDENNKIIEQNVVGNLTGMSQVVTGKELFCFFMKYNSRFFMSWLSLIKRDFLIGQGIRYIDYIIHEDMYFAFQTLMHAKRSMFVNKSFYLWRVREHSITFNKENAHNFKGYLKTYMGVLEYYLANGERELRDINYSIELYLREIKRRLLHVYVSVTDIKQYEWNDNERYMIDMLFSRKENASIQPLHDDVEIPEEVYIYGAGMVAREVLESFGIRNSAVKGFIVSEPKQNPHFLYGIKVYGLSEVSDKDACILVGVSKKFESEILHILEDRGFKNIITL